MFEKKEEEKKIQPNTDPLPEPEQLQCRYHEEPPGSGTLLTAHQFQT